MKKIIAIICSLLTLCFTLAGCGEQTEQPKTETENTPMATEVPADITEKTDYVTETWVAVEIPFTASASIKEISEAEMDVTFKNRSTGTELTMPAFWDGDKDWKVRFAPTQCGIWDFTSKATGADLGLDGKTGTVACNAYKGDLDIYKHGFVKTQENVKYFTYADGTPFFYLGDTHWTMLTEEFDKAGKNAGSIETDSHFKYIVDRRVAQHFTVYQSEPIGHSYDATNGIQKSDISGFQIQDKYFKYIADAGLVHANSQLMFPSEISKKFFEDEAFVRSVSRYWVARYGAYPVMWTLGQEVDDDYFGKNDITPVNNPYKTIAKYIGEADPYKSPLTAHQENACNVGAKGGVPVADASWGGKTTINKPSSFMYLSEHTWWGVQWRPDIASQNSFTAPKDYWDNSTKPAVIYEARYEQLYTGNFGARATGWIAYLCGMFGYGYGGQDMWYYQTTYAGDEESTDGYEVINPDAKKITWGELIMRTTGDELTYMRGFLESVGWWKLVPDFATGTAYVKDVSDKTTFYAVAHDGNDVYVGYFYDQTENATGKFVGLDTKVTYTAQWFNPVTGEYTLIDTEIKAEDGEYPIPGKPAKQDMVLLVTKNAK